MINTYVIVIYLSFFKVFVQFFSFYAWKILYFQCKILAVKSLWIFNILQISYLKFKLLRSLYYECYKLILCMFISVKSFFCICLKKCYQNKLMFKSLSNNNVSFTMKFTILKNFFRHNFWFFFVFLFIYFFLKKSLTFTMAAKFFDFIISLKMITSF